MSFKTFENIYACIIGVIVGFISWLIPNNLLVPSWIPLLFFYVVLVLLLVIIVLKSNYDKTINNLQSVPPMIKLISIQGNRILFTSNFHNFISFGTFVSIYYLENDYEIFCGVAKINNIQANGIIQAIIINTIDNYQQPHINDVILKITLSDDALQLISTA